VRPESSVEERAAVHAALGDPVRLAIVDELAVSDRSPVELRHLTGIESNLMMPWFYRRELPQFGPISTALISREFMS